MYTETMITIPVSKTFHLQPREKMDSKILVISSGANCLTIKNLN